MKIYFARHGESLANVLHIISNRYLLHELTPAGREQARCLAETLMNHNISHIYTSPLLRTVETSAIIADIFNVQYEQVDGLREFDCGIAEGRSDDAAWQLWQAEYDAWVIHHDYDHRIEGGESFQDVQRRFMQFTDWLVDSYENTPAQILCISHGGLYRVMLPFVLNNITLQMMVNYGFRYSTCIVAEHKPDGLHCIEWDGHIVA